jgi:hypothetical protein
MEGYVMRSISRFVVAVAFILALVLSTVPAQAQPRDFGASFATFDGSWLEAAFGWLNGLLGGGDTEPLQSLETGGKVGSGGTVGGVGTMSGSCLDPYGIPCGDNG